MKCDRIENHYLNHEYLLCSVFDFNMDSSIWYRSNGIGNFIAKSLSLSEVIHYLKKLDDEDIARYKKFGRRSKRVCYEIFKKIIINNY